jgi:hypothetical protein
MRENSRAKIRDSNVAFLWDESFLWGLMAYKALKTLGLSFDLINSEDIRKGCLEKYTLLFVPGGWASNKLKALGNEGAEEIRKFVREGGNYFGICGGAGLATMDGIGLLSVRRKPTKERVPSFSGRIYLNLIDHTLWHGQIPQPIFYAWWPSQFIVNHKDIKVLATFGDALPDAFSSDLNVGDVRANGDWKELERLYGINLDPERLKNEPAVVEGRFGRGKVILSLIHFDTPGDKNGAIVLRNVWKYLGATSEEQTERARVGGASQELNEFDIKAYSLGLEAETQVLKGFAELYGQCSEIIDFGLRNFLWFWRTPMIIQWRRGVRGLEYCTLYALTKELIEQQLNLMYKGKSKGVVYCPPSLLSYCSDFKEKAIHLLMLEKKAIERGMITYEYSDDPEIQALRKELFGNSKSHGGLFKQFIDEIDSILFALFS